MVGIGIRIAQDVGAHRKRFMEKQSIESELWKRCFWVLVCIDALVCSFLGRPRATISFDYDLDLPIDCDDEYWETEDPSLAFHQPPGQPSKISSFITYIKLMGILEFAQRFLYSVNRKGKGCPSRGHAQSSDEEVVSRLDSRLNEWFEDIPDHRQFLVSHIDHIADVSTSQVDFMHSWIMGLFCRFLKSRFACRPYLDPNLELILNYQFAIYTSAILLLVGHWTNSKPGAPRDSNNEDLKRVKDCASVLSKLESRWTPAGRFGDVIQEIASYPEAQCTLNHNQNPATDGNAVAAPGNSQSQGLQAPGYQPPFSWGSEVPPKPQGWNLSAQKVPDATHVGSVNEEQWWEGLNPVQFDFTPLGPSPYAHTLRLPTSESEYGTASPRSMMLNFRLDPGTYPQWSFMPQDVTMEVGDVAMLWLQQSQMSEYVSVHPCEDLSNAQ
ncbi:hypothetical protein H0H92_008341 [Tricholoma furcatifolium]|nr:hypothetical protein H0H92_008341 [Tricholoma furcatifolium]